MLYLNNHAMINSVKNSCLYVYFFHIIIWFSMYPLFPDAETMSAFSYSSYEGCENKRGNRRHEKGSCKLGDGKKYMFDKAVSATQNWDHWKPYLQGLNYLGFLHHVCFIKRPHGFSQVGLLGHFSAMPEGGLCIGILLCNSRFKQNALDIK